MDTQALIFVGLAFALGGVLKGATGVGAPLISVPVMTSFFDIRFAVAVFVLPNLITNLVQIFVYQHALKNRFFLMVLCLSGGVGAFAGSLTLYQASSGVLEVLMAGLIIVYVGFRLRKPDWRLPLPMANKLHIPIGFFAGFLQGAVGISAPATLTFLNAIKFERAEFIVIISALFMTMSIVQLPTLIYLGVMQSEHLILGLLAIIPLIGGMPLGALILHRVTPAQFDTLILIILMGVAARLLWGVQ